MEKEISVDGLRERIIKSFEDFSKGEKKVAKYIIDHFLEIALLSSSELAKKAGVSDTTVIRFAKALGFKGFIEFKKAMRFKLNTENSPYDSLKKWNLSLHGQYVQDYISSEVKHLSMFLQQLDYDLIDKIAEKILSAKTIYLIGIDSDSVVVDFLSGYFSKMGFHVISLYHTGFSLRKSLIHLTENDLIIMSSFPRHLKDEKKTAELAKSKNAGLITISDSDVIGALFGSDINISIPDSRPAFFNSNVLSMVLCNIILLRIYEKAPERIEEHLKAYGELVSDSDWMW